MQKTAKAIVGTWIFLGLSFGLSPVYAQSQGDISGIVKRGVLRVSVPNFQAPPFFSERGGQLEGYDIDLARGLAKSLGVEVQFIREAKTFNDAVSAVVRQQADVAICKLSRTMARAGVVVFSEPYLEMRHAMAISRLSFAQIARGRDINTVVRDFNGSIGVIAHSSFEDYARTNFPNAKIVGLKDWTEAIWALREGKVDALYRDELEIKRLVRLDPVFPLLVRTVTLKDTYDSIGIAVPVGVPHLLSYVNLFVAQQSRGVTVDKLLKTDKALAVSRKE